MMAAHRPPTSPFFPFTSDNKQGDRPWRGRPVLPLESSLIVLSVMLCRRASRRRVEAQFAFAVLLLLSRWTKLVSGLISNRSRGPLLSLADCLSRKRRCSDHDGPPVALRIPCLRRSSVTSRQQSTALRAGEEKKGHVDDNKHHSKDESEEERTTPITPISLFNLAEVDVLYGRRTGLVYDASLDRYVDGLIDVDDDQGSGSDGENRSGSRRRRRASWLSSVRQKVAPMLSVAFVPSGVSENYKAYMWWRILQRFVNANLHVFGTQSLLLGLGLKSGMSSSLGASAALNWVLKDALGKIVRMVWASRMGRRFDSDAKRWRFRSSFVYGVGNFLEIVTYIFPSLFLAWATLANCCKQVSMLTSSSTRTAIYNSFQKTEDKTIADITAKGEAQIAVVDLLGITSGVSLSRCIGTSVRSVLAAYFALQAMEIACMYRELRAVQYRVFNFERMVQVIQGFCSAEEEGAGDESVNGHKSASEGKKGGSPRPSGIPTPKEVAVTERIFLPPRHLCRRKLAFGSLGRAKLSPSELTELVSLFRRERFLLVVGANIKSPPTAKNWRFLSFKKGQDAVMSLKRQINCHIVLHEGASNKDIVKSTLALTLLRRKLAEAKHLDPDRMRTSDCMPLIEEAYDETERLFQTLLRELSKQGWESPARLMFGRVHMRADWPLVPRESSHPSRSQSS